MDDLTVTTTAILGAMWILQELQRIMAWACMNFKPAKSRSLVLKKGKVIDRFRFSLGAQQIPSVKEKLVKSFEKVFNCSLNDRESRQPALTWRAG